MSILTENLVRLEHKQGGMLDNLWISLLFRPYSSPQRGLMIATQKQQAEWKIEQLTVAPKGG